MRPIHISCANVGNHDDMHVFLSVGGSVFAHVARAIIGSGGLAQMIDDGADNKWDVCGGNEGVGKGPMK